MTNSPKNHHFVPQFLLRYWSDKSGNLRCWRRRGGVVESFSSTPRKVMRENHLYSARHVRDRAKYEKAFSAIEAAAAKSLSKMLAPGRLFLDENEVHAWAIFLLAQRARTPDKISWAEQQTRKLFKDILGRPDPEFSAVKPDQKFETLLDYMNENRRDIAENFHLDATMKIIHKKENLQPLVRMNWFVRRSYGKPIILSDNPLVLIGSLHHGECVMVLPISPSVVFFATTNSELKSKIEFEDGRSAATRINDAQAVQAQRLVIGDIEPRFLQKRMRG
jgi:hypothetical protein